MDRKYESILTSIKKLLGVSEDCTDFDADIIIHINTAFMSLNQLGVGPDEGFRVDNKNDTWDTYVTDNDDLEAIKTYIYLRVKLLFDPPLNASIIESFKESIRELEWRINHQAEFKNVEEV